MPLNSVDNADSDAALPSFASLLPLALAAALAAGIGELVLRLLARRLLPDPVAINPDSIWLGPLSAVIIFTPLIVVAWLTGRLAGPRPAWTAAVGMAAFLAVFDVLLLIPRFHPMALALLAIGIASQVALLARRRPTG
ncbi:MAG: hypothetical protein ABI910_09020, partial [Gemmatimonadota bacterium]